jgi:hypothetical protein
MSKAAATASGQKWYRMLNATQWKTLLASNLGWVFDGFETFCADPDGRGGLAAAARPIRIYTDPDLCWAATLLRADEVID